MEIDGDELSARTRMDSLDEETTGRSRKRVSRACDRCRVKKDKCDALKPRCSPCVAINAACTYNPSSKKRGLPEGYVRGLEKLWALSVMKIDGLEEAIKHIATQQQNIRLWSNEATGEVLHARWKDSSVLHELESMLSRTEQDAGANRKRKRDIESEALATFEDPISAVYNLQTDYQIVHGRGRVSAPNEATEEARLAIERDKLSLPAKANVLLEHYFAYTHCWLPVVEKHKVMRTFHEYAKEQRRISNADAAVLWAILAFSGQQLDHDGLERKPAEILTVAQALIPESGPFELGHVQALLLITLLNLGLGKWESAWILIGIASRGGLQLRSIAISHQKRLAATLQACCIFDTLIAEHLKLQPHLRRRDLQNLEYLEEDGSEDWEPWRASESTSGGNLEPAFTNTCFNRFIDAVLILNDLITFNKQTEADQQIFFEDRRAALVVLESKYPALGSGTGVMPHQLLLRLVHSGVSMSISKSAFEAGNSADSWARAACGVLSLLEQHKQASALAFRNIMPILAVPLRAATYAAFTSKQTLQTLRDLPSYTDFADRMTTIVIQFSSTWAIFSPLASLLHADDLKNGARVDNSGTNSRLGDHHQDWSGRTPGRSSLAADPNAWVASNTYLQDMIDPQLSREDSLTTLQTNTHMQTPKQSGTGIPMSVVSNSTPAGLAMPAATEASPSFYGDDVDAIFHNLIHLDTTDWTDNRQKGLAEFGFADEDAFQAFCNDPDRLLATNNATGQASFNASAEPWPPPGLFPGHFNDTQDAQMEASQILQSLSGQSQSTVQTSNRGTWWS